MHKNERLKREVWSAEGATIEAPRVGWGFSLPSGDRGITPLSGEGLGEGLCPSPENFPNFCLEIACYNAFWKPFFKA